MSAILKIKAAMNTKAARIKELAALEASQGELTAEQLTEFTQLEAAYNKDKEALARAELAEGLDMQTASPVAPALGAPAVHVKAEPENYLGAKLARFSMAIAAGQGDLGLAQKFAANEIGDKDVALAVSTAAGSGGALVPQRWSNEVIELLRAQSVMRKLGARSIPLPNGNATIPRLSGGATSTYKGENAAVNASAPTTDDVKLSAKTQISIVPISNELIGYAGYNVEQLFLNDIIAATAEHQDAKFLRGDGTNSTPTGMRKTAQDSGRVIPWSGTITAQAVDQFLGALILALEEANSAMRMPGWVLSPRTKQFLADLYNDKGVKVYPEIANGYLKGYPFATTTNVPSNLGASSNESEITFADFSDVLIGETGQYEVSFSKEATYKDASGNLQSAYSNNQSVLRLVTANDIGFRHLEGLVLGTAVPFTSSFNL
jgi:HK97 family phage major capsid protein